MNVYVYFNFLLDEDLNKIGKIFDNNKIVFYEAFHKKYNDTIFKFVKTVGTLFYVKENDNKSLDKSFITLFKDGLIILEKNGKFKKLAQI